ncbi:DNA (cytosine-5)-methyltransferase DRM2-like [Miscanthus floridulus]|uniref:DNA (cytosine-5)-methyltransferase DRM2-like n=1 Tax=Miscanthus floridulus TaxID=154761 RepID=UPI003458732F
MANIRALLAGLSWARGSLAEAGRCASTRPSLLASLGAHYKDFLHEMSHKDDKIDSLVKMGFPEDEATLAITRCGLDASIYVMVDSIYASQTAGYGYCGNLSDYEDNSYGGINKGRFMDGNKKKEKDIWRPSIGK